MKQETAKMNNGQQTLTNRHETLFLWDVWKSNPNGDPSGNEPRIDRHTKRCDVTDVCIKRSVRNYIALASKEGTNALLVTKLGEDASETVTLTERIIDYLFGNKEKIKKTKELVERAVEEKLNKDGGDLHKSFLNQPSSKTFKALFDSKKGIPKELQKEIKKVLRTHLCAIATDLRMFGSVLALDGDMNPLRGPLTGPIQVEIATSLHRVVQANKQITSVLGSREELEAGIIGDTHCIEYGLFATSAVANENVARFTGLSDDDHGLFLKALWRGIRERHTRSKNGVPRFLIDIEYNKPFHFGDLVNSVRLNPVEDPRTAGKKLEEEQYRRIKDFKLDLSEFYKKLCSKKEAIEKIRFADNGLITFEVFKNGLPEGLKKKAESIRNIDYDVDQQSQRGGGGAKKEELEQQRK